MSAILRPETPAILAPRTRPWRPAIGVRRFGCNDYERFDQETACGSHLCVGAGSIGGVSIECKYHWKRAEWGILGADQRPAGIVYMDITFRQPYGYWLKRAAFFITLSEEDSSNAVGSEVSEKPHRPAWRSGKKTRRPFSSEFSVQMTDYFGPRHLTGSKTTRAEETHDSFIPTVAVQGVEFGGVGRESITEKERTGRWEFRGTVCRPEGGEGLRTLLWEFRGNELDPDQTAQKQEYRTGFAFEHSRRPVLMRVKVEGKLRSWSQRLRHTRLRFGKKDNTTLTRMDLSTGDAEGPTKRLDSIARGLDKAMEMENCENPPVEMPGPIPALFYQDPLQGGLNSSVAWGAAYHRHGSHLISGFQRPAEQGLLSEAVEEPLLLRLQGPLLDDQTRDDIITDASALRPSMVQDIDPAGRRQRSPGSTETQFPGANRDADISTAETATAMNGAPSPVSSTAVGSRLLWEVPDDDAISEVMKIPAVLAIVKFIVLMMTWFSGSRTLVMQQQEQPLVTADDDENKSPTVPSSAQDSQQAAFPAGTRSSLVVDAPSSSPRVDIVGAGMRPTLRLEQSGFRHRRPGRVGAGDLGRRRTSTL